MRFLRVEIRNFRNFEAIDLDLTDGALDRPLPIAVIVGPNGSGKTAILEACLRLSFPFGYTAAREGTRPLPSELRSSCHGAQLAAMLLPSASESQASGQFGPQRASLRIQGRSGAPLQLTAAPDETKCFNLVPPPLVYLDSARHSARGSVASVTAAMRLWTKQQIVNMKFTQMLEREQGNEDRTFDRLWEIVHRVLERVRFSVVTPELEILFNTPSGVVEFDDLSSGEKTIIAMFTDLLARRLSEVVILIDEIELHLHPRWQYKILGALRELLPDCQFIVTTQSPVVAASVHDAKYIFKLGGAEAP